MATTCGYFFGTYKWYSVLVRTVTDTRRELVFDFDFVKQKVKKSKLRFLTSPVWNLKIKWNVPLNCKNIVFYLFPCRFFYCLHCLKWFLNQKCKILSSKQSCLNDTFCYVCSKYTILKILKPNTKFAKHNGFQIVLATCAVYNWDQLIVLDSLFCRRHCSSFLHQKLLIFQMNYSVQA